MHKAYSRASDIFMFGITAWEIFHEIQPYKDEHPVAVGIAVVRDNRRPVPLLPPADIRPRDMKPFSRPEDWEVLLQMMEDCWWEKPQDRITTSQILTRIENCISKYDEMIGEKNELFSEMDMAEFLGEDRGYLGRKVIGSLPPLKFGPSSRSQKGLLSPCKFEIVPKSSEENECLTPIDSASVLHIDGSPQSLVLATETNYDNINGFKNLQPIRENTLFRSHVVKQERVNGYETPSHSVEFLNHQSNNVKASRRK